MGSQRISTPQGDNPNKRPNGQGQNQGQPRPKSNNTVLANTQTRKGEVFRAQRRTSEDVNMRASQHIINVPVNKSLAANLAWLIKKSNLALMVQNFALCQSVD
jgi:ribonuclease J